MSLLPTTREGRRVRHREGERPIPNYKLESFLGEGGYGEVWRAVGPGGVPCALKFIKIDTNAGLKELRSIGLVKRLRHPNLVPLNAVWLRDEDGNLMTEGDNGESISFRVYGNKELVIAMGLGSGSLADKLAGARAEKAADALPGGLGLRKLLGYMQDAARGIDCLNDPPAHDNPGVLPIVHCDIKPANLLLVGGGVQVCDYGVAKAVGKDIKKTMAAGTAAYAPPELINNDPGLKSDQYSLAISYYELRTGHLPLDETKAMMAHLMGMLDFARVPADEREVLQQATAMKVTDRFATCEEFVEALHVASGRTVTAASGPRSYPLNRKSSGGGSTSDEIMLEKEAPPAAAPRPTSEVLRPSGSPVPGFSLVRLLGQGGYGQVWQATDEDGVGCALKILRDVQGKGRHEYETLVRLRRLDHPNLLRIEKLWVLDQHWAPIPAEQLGLPDGREARRLVIRTPLADKNLFQRLTECRRHSQPGMPVAELLRDMKQAADALDYLNIDQQTQHRDVKPENLLLKGETLWVSDFGLAKVVPTGGVTAQSTSSGMTQEYASPEVLTNRQVTDRSDQYSLAVTYHVLRTGRLPFPNGLSMLELIKARASTSLDLSAVTEGERPVLKRALSAHPGDRFDTCRELLNALAAALNLSATHESPTLPPEPPRKSGPPARRSTPTPAARGTIEFSTTEVRFEPEDEPPSRPAREWAQTGDVGVRPVEARPRPGRKPVADASFADEKPAGNKLLVGVLASLAVAAVGVGGYVVVSGKTGTEPTAPKVAEGGETPVTDQKGTAPTDTGSPVTAKTPTPEERIRPVRDAIARRDSAAADQLTRLRGDPSEQVQRWAAAWLPVVQEQQKPAPTKVTSAELVELFGRIAPANAPAVLHPDELTAARKELLTSRAAIAVPAFGADADWPKVKEVLAAADPANPWVAAGRAEAALATGEPAEFTRDEPAGFAGYVRGLAQWKAAGLDAGKRAEAADTLAATPLDANWMNPRRAGLVAGSLAEAVAAVRRPADATGPFPPDQTDRVAGWLTAADRAFALAGKSADPAARDRLGVDTVVLASVRPADKLMRTVAADRDDLADSAAVRSLSGELQVRFWAAFADTRRVDPAGRLAAVRGMREVLAAARATDPAARPGPHDKWLADRLAGDADLTGPDRDPEVRRAVADLLAEYGRELFRNRDRWAGKNGFRAAGDTSARAARLFERAAGLAGRAEDVAWQGIAQYFQRLKPEAVPSAVARAAGSGVAGQVLAALLGSAKPDPDREAVQAAWETAVARGEREEARYRDELTLAYNGGGYHSILLAHLTPARRTELLRTAADWGAKLARAEPDKADGPNLEGNAREDMGWLTRTPDDRSKRCGPDGPYAAADRLFEAASRRPLGNHAYASVNRGRNLFKWVEDECQLGSYRDDPTDKARPNSARLKAAEGLLLKAGTAAEPRFWLAEVAALKYEAVGRKLWDGNQSALAEEAIWGLEQVLATSDEASAGFRQDAPPRLERVYREEARRLAAAGQPAKAATLLAKLAQSAEAAKQPAAARAVLLAEVGRLHLTAGEKAGNKAAHWPDARGPLEAAVQLDPAAPDRWRWRFDLGRLEHWAAGQAKGAEAKTRYALAVNHLRAFLFMGYAELLKRPSIKPEYDQLQDARFEEMLKSAGDSFGQFDANQVPAGVQSVWRLAQIDARVQADKGYMTRGIPADTREEVGRLMDAVTRDKGGLEPRCVDAARDISERLALYPAAK